MREIIGREQTEGLQEKLLNLSKSSESVVVEIWGCSGAAPFAAQGYTLLKGSDPEHSQYPDRELDCAGKSLFPGCYYSLI